MANVLNAQRMVGNIALVTGGASGLGRALSEALAMDGAFVVVADINHSKAEEVAAGIRHRGGSGEAASLDVSSEAKL
jgi:NAD(P)-dependent dehydrogenase (short-subunit alcohol dehydrogenase family)